VGPLLFTRDFVSFRTAHTQVSGRWVDEETVLTTATSIIEDLSILQVVTADRIVSRLTSTHKRGKREGHIVAVGAIFKSPGSRPRAQSHAPAQIVERL